MTFLGISKDVTRCDKCGKSRLPRTFVVRDDETGDVLHLGSECAKNALGLEGSSRALAHKLRRLERRQGSKLAPALVNAEDVPSIIEGEIDGAVERARKAGAKPPLTYVGAGMTAIVLTDGKLVYKVARHFYGTLAAEAEWFQAALKVPEVRPYVPKHVRWDATHGVLAKDYVRGRPGRWSDEGALGKLHDKIGQEMRRVGWTAPEFKGDSYILDDEGRPTLIDASMAIRVGPALVDYVEDVLAGRRELGENESLDDLAFAVRAEVIARHNRRGTISIAEARRLLAKLEKAGATPDEWAAKWEEV